MGSAGKFHCKGWWNKMAYYGSPKQYENARGKRFTTQCPCIHVSGSVSGMVKLGYWSEKRDKVRHGSWIYLQP